MKQNQAKETIKEIQKDLFDDLKEDRKPEDRLLSIIILVLRLHFDFDKKKIGTFLGRIKSQAIAKMVLANLEESRDIKK